MVETNNAKHNNNDVQEEKLLVYEEKQEIQYVSAVKKRDTFFLYFTMLTAILPGMSGGAIIVWASPAVVKLKSNESEVNPLERPITTSEISILLGVPILIALAGTFTFSKLGDIIGRKRSIQLLVTLMFLSTIGLSLSKRVCLFVMFYSCSLSLFAGIWGLLTIYLTEISEDHNRAKYTCLMTAFIPLGQLFMYAIGPIFTLQMFTLLSIAPSIPFLILFNLAPESPVYLLKMGKKKESFEVIRILRKNKTNNELQIDFDLMNKSLSISNSKKDQNVVSLFRNKEGRTGILLAIIPVIAQCCSGVPLVTSLLAPIFNESGSKISGDNIAIYVGVVEVFGFVLTSCIIEKTGRKSLLLFSSFGTGLFATILGIYFYLKHINSSAISDVEFLPIVAVIGYILIYSLGLGPIPVAVTSELFIPELRTAAMAVVTTSYLLFLDIVAFAYPPLGDIIGTHWCFWIFGFFCFVSFILIYAFIPETKGKTIMDIQEILKRKKIDYCNKR